MRRKAAAIGLPLLVVVWLVVVIFPELIPGDYESSYLLPLIVSLTFVAMRVVSTPKKRLDESGQQSTPSATTSAAGKPPVSTESAAAEPSPAPDPASAPAATTVSTATEPIRADDLDTSLVTRLRELRSTGRTVEAVEVLRAETGMELYEASRLVIGLEDPA